MKKNIFLVLAFLSVLAMSCQQDALDPTGDTDYEDIVLSAARYSVAEDSATKAHCKGRLTELAADDIPTPITDYIRENFDGATLKFAAKDAKGNVVVGLTLADGSYAGLLFDNEGTFRQQLKQFKKRAKLTKIAVADVPAAVSAYIVGNYFGAEIKHAGTNEEGKLFVLIKHEDKPVVLLFDADGTFEKMLEKPEKKPKRFAPWRK